MGLCGLVDCYIMLVAASKNEGREVSTPLGLIGEVFNDNEHHHAADEDVVNRGHGFGCGDEGGEKHWIDWGSDQEEQDRLPEGDEEDIEDEE